VATTTVITCDLHADGSTPAEQTVTFGLNNKQYEIDLCAGHLEEFTNAIGRFIDAGARELGGGRRPRRESGAGAGSAGRRGGPDLNEVREWARKQGLQVSDRGRVAASIMEAFEGRNRRRGG
jgi:hypothetical protein